MLRLITFLLIFTVAYAAEKKYDLGPDSKVQNGVPKGNITHHSWKSKVFPGTIRHYSVYVPAQYKGEKAAVMVFQDGHAYLGQFKTPIVFDNLIHKKELPVIIGIFIDPGFKKSVSYRLILILPSAQG